MNKKVKAKKHLGQHFLLDLGIASQIVDLVPTKSEKQGILEIGPGMGVLTQFMVKRNDFDIKVVEIDTESVEYLHEHFDLPKEDIINEDFLKMRLDDMFSAHAKYTIIGNFPYNISSQIFFSVLDYVDSIEHVVCMLQKEVGKRIASGPGNKDYGILSVFLQAYYDINYEFTIGPQVFDPPPKVDSCVISLKRNYDKKLPVDFKKFKNVVKTAFNQRRKMLSNALSPLTTSKDLPYATMRAEQLSYIQFIELTQFIFPS
ncbi:MAG: 16S rRNA (adenine(1518)-N(6)/adenine(1519)-N(6))-dimethyltransferase RsmA [Leadbetterella sp.]